MHGDDDVGGSRGRGRGDGGAGEKGSEGRSAGRLGAGGHNSAAFVAFLESLLASVRPKQEVHIILDNLSVHKSRHVQRFLADHPRLHFHFTPTYSSWLNQVEIWFSRIERDGIARGVFTSVKDLARKLMRYLKRHNQHARPIKWRYSDPSHRIHSSAMAVAGH
jgi:transposase